MLKEDYRPQFITKNALQKFLKSHKEITIVDAFLRQLKELFFIDNHTKTVAK